MSLILSPFSWLLATLNGYFDSYGIAIIIFAVFVKILLFPFSIKGKRGMIQMNMLSGQMAQLKKLYGNNPNRYNQEVQDLYVREQVNPFGGCLWTFLPLFVLLPLYAIIREPIEYIIGLSEEQIYMLANEVNWDVLAVQYEMVTQESVNKALEKSAAAGGSVLSGFENNGYNQLHLASFIPENGIVLSDGRLVEQMNFHFFGIDLTKVPNWKIWQDMTYQNFGRLFLVAISACSGIVFSKVSQKTNKMNTNQPRNEQMEQTNRMMMWTMPIMSIWIGLIMPSIMVVYWIANNLLSMIQETVAGQILKKDYEEMRIAQEKRQAEEKIAEKLAKEEKIKEIERKKEELAKNKGKKKKKPVKTTEVSTNNDASREGMRIYARGRAYDPDRYPNPNQGDGMGKAPEKTDKITSSEEKVEKIETPTIPEDTTWDTVLNPELPETTEETGEEKEAKQETETGREPTADQATKDDWEAQKAKLKEEK